ncbi:enoyl-CoA hydratase/isomerase family protein [Rhodalgimonas zhirmunskyi]|uniref:Enoyl-CoA hydratase-related protein n=1 Tax=Rhodalgimonas zhirmunskyi TaxID=2964767 RepID=A0AAJ1UFV3_9RHOB|nr:enoyl-CoA hydratase-related protein [Rhodoalgimonas zhirmunskyi]MDQ2095147.1 enoyl-CoA hydratase-related protein [Rhodoalgimonas zhirmunskyi]
MRPNPAFEEAGVMAFDGLKERFESDGILLLRMAEPERRNALSDAMRAALRDALHRAHADRQVRAIVLSGSDGCFCAGGDIKAMGQPIPIAMERLEVVHDIVRLIALGPKPVVAAVDGAAYGGGMSLALCCDAVVAAEGARFCASFGRIGLVPDMGIMWSLPRRVGAARAQQILLDGRERGGAEAVETGIADILSMGDPVPQALATARALTPAAPLPAAHLRPIIARCHGDLDAVLNAEREAQEALFATRDHEEARRAFLEKRLPQFIGT